MQMRAMTKDFSWRRSAQRYFDIYRELAWVPEAEHNLALAAADRSQEGMASAVARLVTAA